MLQWRLYGGKSLPNNLSGLLKASANIGSVIGQFGFGTQGSYVFLANHLTRFHLGYLADSLGRRAVCECSFYLPDVTKS